MSDLWQRCLDHLENEIKPEDFHAWLMPLQARENGKTVQLFAPNDYTVDTVRSDYLERIRQVLDHLAGHQIKVSIEVGSAHTAIDKKAGTPSSRAAKAAFDHHLDPHYTFDNFVVGKSNQMGHAAAMQVAQSPGTQYNPLLLYGGTGLGKTHLMHAAGSLMRHNNPDCKVLYVRSEQFINAMIAALRSRSMDSFKKRFRSIDALLVDDIQMFAGKNTSQEEIFHTFNALLEGKQQIIVTCDRYPKEIDKLEPRLTSRLGWGLPIAIEPPDFETRAAILQLKAQQRAVELPDELVMLLAKSIRSNVRDLEGALNTLAARSHFFNRPITVDFAKETLRDLLNTHAMALSIPNIQKQVADYYQIRLSDMLSKRRVRSIARPRQMAMALAKELTEHSLPEIGDAFGGRDHTTVLHACRTIRKLVEQDAPIKQDWERLIRILSG